VTPKAFTAAVVASRVRSSDLGNWPFDVELALGSGGVARPNPAWKETLKNGLLDPVELRRPQTQPVRQMISKLA
jgi:hypothetical protein